VSTGAVIGLSIAVLVVLGVLVLVTTARRNDARRGEGALSRETLERDRAARKAAEPALVGAPPAPATGREIEQAARQASTELVKAPPVAPAPYVPPDPEVIGVTRRQFFNRGTTLLMTAGIASFGAACLGFLWYAARGGFGGRINAGNLNDIKAGIDANDGFYYVPEARSWITAYPADALPNAERVYPPPVLAGMQAGIAVLYQKCPHLGCRVPQCASSQWFECPCHGSQYNQAGEKKAGPAPRGMDRFGVQIAGGNVTIDTGIIFQGPPIGTNTTGQEAEGPHCITGGAEGEH
jgi:cytochrome b6-f complex iron-sulfur subunit